MNDPQIWSMIGVVALVIGVMQWSFTSLRREMQAGFARQDAKMEALDSKIDGVEARLDAKIDDRFDRTVELMEARFSDVGHRLGSLEADMGLIKGHLLGQRSA